MTLAIAANGSLRHPSGMRLPAAPTALADVSFCASAGTVVGDPKKWAGKHNRLDNEHGKTIPFSFLGGKSG